MTDNVAILAGFTREITAEFPCVSLCLLIEPDTDLDGTFRAWDMDEQEFISVNGWLADVEEVADHRRVESAIQCTAPTGEVGTFLFRRNVGRPIHQGELVSPVFASLADLAPWATANGWASVPGSWEYRLTA